MSIETNCGVCGAEYDMRHGECPVCTYQKEHPDDEDEAGSEVPSQFLRHDAHLATKGDITMNRQQTENLLEAVRILLANAELIPDPRMQGATDCYAVTLDDLETVQSVLANSKQGDEAGSEVPSHNGSVSEPHAGYDCGGTCALHARHKNF